MEAKEVKVTLTSSLGQIVMTTELYNYQPEDQLNIPLIAKDLQKPQQQWQEGQRFQTGWPHSHCGG